MAEARIEVAVSAEVRLVPDEKTAAWLVSLGWTPPVADCTCNSREVRDGDVVHYDDCEYIKALPWDCDRCGKSLPSSVQSCPCPERPRALTGAEAYELQQREAGL